MVRGTGWDLRRLLKGLWNFVLGVDLTGQFLRAREAAKEFVRRGVQADLSCSAGKIICVSSVHDQILWAGQVNYAASKGGIAMYEDVIL
ncbi:MAG: SDR family NAD(P)-dependent oxidoreductase [Chromatiaceae bacterium]